MIFISSSTEPFPLKETDFFLPVSNKMLSILNGMQQDYATAVDKEKIRADKIESFVLTVGKQGMSASFYFSPQGVLKQLAVKEAGDKHRVVYEWFKDAFTIGSGKAFDKDPKGIKAFDDWEKSFITIIGTSFEKDVHFYIHP